MEELKNMVMEIGTEEIPAGFIPPAIKQLKDLALKGLEDYRLSFKEVFTFGTPRRMVLFITGLSFCQAEMVKEVKGPPSKVAYASDGNPTPSAMGFARAQKVELKDLFIKKMPQGEYVFARVKEVSKSTPEVMAELLPSLIKSIYFPKNMYWDDSGIRFARPIRWLLALFGNEVIPLKLGNLEAGRITFGHRFLSSGPLEIPSCDEFKDILYRNRVILDNEARKDIILKEIKLLIEKRGFNLWKYENLLEEVNYLVEYATPFMGDFSSEYLSLPVELLTTVMEKHQRYFPLVDGNGNILPHFIAVRNGDTRGLDLVKAGNEKVIAARLSDAMYFFDTDKKVSPGDLLLKLKDIGFQKNLGNMYDKTMRLIELSSFIATTMGREDLKEDVRRASELCKADLATHMVFEFPELQGVMGGIYSSLQGEKESVWEAIRSHYKPAFSQDSLPETPAGQIISFADKLDSVAGCLGAGYMPTGSADPYGVRRNTLAILRILLDGDIKGNLLSCFSKALSLYEEQGINLEKKDDTGFEVFAFQRLENYLLSRGFRYDVIKSVRAGAFKDLKDTCRRIEALFDIRELPEFEPLVISFTRACNILKKSMEGTPVFSSQLLMDEHEKKLYEEFSRTYDEVEKAFSAETDYTDIMRKLSSLRPWIDNFFDNVMVMVPEEDLRNNRLALLDMVVKLYIRVADFSEIVVEGNTGR